MNDEGWNSQINKVSKSGYIEAPRSLTVIIASSSENRIEEVAFLRNNNALPIYSLLEEITSYRCLKNNNNERLFEKDSLDGIRACRKVATHSYIDIIRTNNLN